MIESSNVIAVVGIDGSGKTTVINKLLAQSAPAAGEVMTLTCPRYHDTPNAPLSQLSTQLQALSDAGDALGSPEVKVTAMLLQMSLYGPVERFFLDTFRPRLLVCEHHALIDTLAFGAIYADAVRAAVSAPSSSPPIEARLRDHLPSGTLESIHAWFASENRRLGRDLGLWELASSIAELLRRPIPEVVAECEQLFRAQLPDVVVLLDVSVETALARLAARAGQGAAPRELHEQAPLLAKLGASYEQVFAYLRAQHPQVHVVVVNADDGSDLDAIGRQVLASCSTS